MFEACSNSKIVCIKNDYSSNESHFEKDGYISEAHGRWLDAQPKFEDAGENWSCDGLASKSKEPM